MPHNAALSSVCPKTPAIQKILVIGSGPIVIGQGCEFDYSGVQACKALKEEGYEVVLVNSNPATIMTDPEFAHRTYIEPITPEVVEKIIIREKPDALLPTLGGQTALNTSMALFKSGVLEKHGVRMIGANAEAIDKGEDRQLFKDAMIKIGLDLPRSGIAHTMEEAQQGRRGNRHASRSSSAPPSPSAARAAASPTTARSSRKSSPAASTSRPSPRSSSRNRCSAGRNSRWRSCATAPTTAWSSARSRTSTPWASTPATRSPSRPIQTLTDREYQIMRDASFAVHPRDRRGNRRLEHPVRHRSRRPAA